MAESSPKYPNPLLVISVAHASKLKPDTIAVTLAEAFWYAQQGDVAGVKAVCPFVVEVQLGESTR